MNMLAEGVVGYSMSVLTDKSLAKKHHATPSYSMSQILFTSHTHSLIQLSTDMGSLFVPCVCDHRILRQSISASLSLLQCDYESWMDFCFQGI